MFTIKNVSDHGGRETLEEAKFVEFVQDGGLNGEAVVMTSNTEPTPSFFPSLEDRTVYYVGQVYVMQNGRTVADYDLSGLNERE